MLILQAWSQILEFGFFGFSLMVSVTASRGGAVGTVTSVRTSTGATPRSSVQVSTKVTYIVGQINRRIKKNLLHIFYGVLRSSWFALTYLHIYWIDVKYLCKNIFYRQVKHVFHTLLSCYMTSRANAVFHNVLIANLYWMIWIIPYVKKIAQSKLNYFEIYV